MKKCSGINFYLVGLTSRSTRPYKINSWLYDRKSKNEIERNMLREIVTFACTAFLTVRMFNMNNQ